MKITNELGLPASLIAVLHNDGYDENTKENEISVTQLIDSPKVRLLSRLHKDELEQDASESLWMLLGSAIHSVMERAKNPKYIIEKRMELPVGNYILRGKPDLYDIESGELQDWKITSVWSYIFKDRPTGKTKSWTEQLNIYAYLLGKSGHNVRSLTNNLILRDHQRSKAKADADYPAVPFVSVTQKLWTTEQVEQFIFDRVKIHSEAEKVSDLQSLVCGPYEKMTKESVFSIYKEGSKAKSSTKNCSSLEEAQAYIKPLAEKYEIRERPGADVRCLDYCPVRAYCNHAKGIQI